MKARPPSRVFLFAALASNALIAVTKCAAAAMTGSSVMLSEGVHSIVDLENELLLLYGLRRASRVPDRQHPLGHGREIYFWSFVVALLVFALGAGVSIFVGISHVLRGKPITNVTVNYVVLGLSAVFEGVSWSITWRKFNAEKGSLSVLKAIRTSKDPPTFIVLLEDSAALVGLVIAFAGVFLSTLLDRPVLDGMASILVGLVLAVTAVLLARETKGLLIGERADPGVVASILRNAEEIEGVEKANGVITVHLAPQEIVVALSLEFADNLRTPEIEQKVVELERRLREAHPEVTAIFVKPQSPGGFKKSAGRLHEKAAGMKEKK
jgi:cation diffusion facilitator family transporter